MWKKIFKNIFKLAVAGTLLYIIFIKIDINRLQSVLLQTNIIVFIFGIVVMCIGQVFLTVLRWKYAIQECCQQKISYIFLLNHYWIGMFLGYFMPASIGWDIYRVQSIYRHYGALGKNILVIFSEKFISLLGTILIVLSLYPLIKGYSIETIFQKIVNVSVFGLFFFLLFFVGILLFKQNFLQSRVGVMVEKKIDMIIRRMKNKNPNEHIPNESLASVIAPFISLKFLLIMFFFAVMIRLSSGVANLIFFDALHTPVSLAVNVFVVSLLTIVFLLPISFGSLGVREGAFIVLYGMFGIEKELALTVSFMRLFGLLLFVLIGGVIFIFVSKKRTVSNDH